MPQHTVLYPNKQKIRKVLNAASKYRRDLLNSQLIPGPDLMQNLTAVFCRFRHKKVAITAETEGMFYLSGCSITGPKIWKKDEKTVCF